MFMFQTILFIQKPGICKNLHMINVCLARRFHRVLLSSSLNIYENLAVEDWLYENADLRKDSILLMWRNKPVVVYGRHQNPWVECNINAAERLGIDLARRRSGGGTVYHDEGNLNCSFLLDKSLYDRRRNLQLVIDALKSRWHLNLALNQRDDIILDGEHKVSGTASKIGGRGGMKTYHHFTLLFNADLHNLRSVLDFSLEGVNSKATASTRSSVTNLKDHASDIDYQSLVHVISQEFVRNHQMSEIIKVDPMDSMQFPGVKDHMEELSSWEWRFGKTPPFHIQRQFQDFGDIETSINIKIKIEHGLAHDFEIDFLPVSRVDERALMIVKLGLKGIRFQRKELYRKLLAIKMEWISNQIYDDTTCKLLDWMLVCIMKTFGVFKSHDKIINTMHSHIQ